MVYIYALFTAFFLSIPFLNTKVLKTVNIEEVKKEAREHVDSINTLKDEGLYTQMREYCWHVDSIYSKRNDAPSLFLSQYALLNAAVSYQLASEWEEAVFAFEELLERYPETIFAEQVFFMAGDGLMQDKRYEEAMQWFKKIEQNRELALSFPKYKNVELPTGKYANLDELSQPKEKQPRIYTNEQRKKEANRKDVEEGGNILSDAVVKIGKCYLELNKNDSARSQFELIQEYFPDSDRLDDVQKLIADSYFQEGQRLLEESVDADDAGKKRELREDAVKQFKLAEKEYYKFINRFGESELVSKVYIQLAASNFSLGDSITGEKILGDAIQSLKLIERQALVQLEIGNFYSKSNSPQKAAIAYEKVVQNYPETKHAGAAQFRLGSMFEELNDTAKAMEAYEKIIESYRSSDFFPEAGYRLARHHLDNKRYKQAEEYFELVVRTYPNHVVAGRSWFELGMISYGKKDWREAVRRLEYALGSPASYLKDKAAVKIADAWKAMGDTAKAQEYFGKVEDQTLKDELFWEEEGSKEVPSEKLARIAKKLEEKNQAKDRAFWFEQLAEVRKELQQPDSAIMALDSALSYTRNKVKAAGLNLTKSGILSSDEVGRYSEARTLLADLEEERRLTPQHRAKIRFDLADTYRKAGDEAGAIESFREFVERYGDSQDFQEKMQAAVAQLQIAEMFSRLNMPDSARKEYERFMNNFPDDERIVRAILGAGETFSNSGKPLEAIDYIKGKLEEFKSNPYVTNNLQQIQFQVAEIYAGLAHEKNSKEHYQEAERQYKKVLEGDTLSTFYSAAAFKLGTHYLKWRDFSGDELTPQAEKAFAMVRKDHPDYFKNARNELSKILAKRDWKQAVANLNEAVEQSRNDYLSYKEKEKFQKADQALNETVIAIMAVGQIYSDQDKPEEAAAEFTTIFEKYPEADSTLKAQAMIQAIQNWNQAERFDTLRTLVERMEKEYPESPLTGTALYFKANSYYVTGTKRASNFAKGVEAFNEAIDYIESMPDSGKSLEKILEVSYYLKGDCLFNSKQYAKANQAYETFLNKFPKGKFRCLAVFQQGNSYWARENYQPAANKYSTVDKTCSQGEFQQYCLNKGRYGLAMEKLEKPQVAQNIYKRCKNVCRASSKDYEFCHERSQSLLIEHF